MDGAEANWRVLERGLVTDLVEMVRFEGFLVLSFDLVGGLLDDLVVRGRDAFAEACLCMWE
jgi:hypothetical protein